ncbi:hypothetical protein MPSEU_000757600 [Mayamaea pseudoterrestris]|nr:hypothetical protein MPSEU_000757600 [Mayamaea pseudoterrestris]
MVAAGAADVGDLNDSKKKSSARVSPCLHAADALLWSRTIKNWQLAMFWNVKMLIILFVLISYDANAYQTPCHQLTTAARQAPITKLHQARRNNPEFYDENDDYDDEDYGYERPLSNSRRRRSQVDNLGEFDESTGLDLPSGFGRRSGWRLPDSVSKSLLAGVFVLGVGLGVTIDSQVNTNPKDLASRDAIDQAAPNPTLCAKLGASAMAFDQRVFVSFNPFNVYVSQADVKPACVLRQENVVSVLRERGLIDDAEVRACKNNMNTWAFVGNLGETPQLSCVYKSQDAQNEFLSNPKLGLGEDYLDDDREGFRKQLKIGGTQAQQQAQAQKEEMLRKSVQQIPILEVNGN